MPRRRDVDPGTARPASDAIVRAANRACASYRETSGTEFVFGPYMMKKLGKAGHEHPEQRIGLPRPLFVQFVPVGAEHPEVAEVVRRAESGRQHDDVEFVLLAVRVDGSRFRKFVDGVRDQLHIVAQQASGSTYR